MKARNYNKVLSAFAIVGATALMAFVLENFNSPTKAKSEDTNLKSKNIIQFSIDDSLDAVTKHVERVKIFDAQDALIAEFIAGEPVSDETLKLYRQADFLSKFNNLNIYKLSE
ncbi:hypothetical protein [Roseivirga echinicomitans]|uniref:Uncharacterized protein n=1 Tax=Roseivirga echinicomitans TaxID=296218 RepID=A0A150XSQ4_9BACT|nr:hypothetical protein [Roseivirga echinicomitans]KYG81777.1 hypothetical protein AWN68_16230 [Roseivirga echinicomitans]